MAAIPLSPQQQSANFRATFNARYLEVTALTPAHEAHKGRMAAVLSQLQKEVPATTPSSSRSLSRTGAGGSSGKIETSSRYFETAADLSVVCWRCGEVGHMSTRCTNEAKLQPCFLCARRGHSMRACRQQLCFRWCVTRLLSLPRARARSLSLSLSNHSSLPLSSTFELVECQATSGVIAKKSRESVGSSLSWRGGRELVAQRRREC